MYIFLLLVLINITSINFIYYPEILYYFVEHGTKIFDDVVVITHRNFLKRLNKY